MNLLRKLDFWHRRKGEKTRGRRARRSSSWSGRKANGMVGSWVGGSKKSLELNSKMKTMICDETKMTRKARDKTRDKRVIIHKRIRGGKNRTGNGYRGGKKTDTGRGGPAVGYVDNDSK